MNLGTILSNHISLFATYDAGVVTKGAFKSQILNTLTNFKNDVLAVDEMLPISYLSNDKKAFKRLSYIKMGSVRRLAILQEHNDYSILSRLSDKFFGTNLSQYYLFDHWVSDEMKETAISKVGGESNVMEVNKAQVGGLK